MDRYVVDTAVTLEVTFLAAETPTSAGSVTVAVAAADGTVVATGAATSVGTGVYRYTVSAAANTVVNRWTAAWTGTVAGQAQTLRTYAEIVGGYHVSLAQLRALDPLSDTAKYPTADLMAARAIAETVIEEEAGVAFVPRYWYGTVSRLGRWPVDDVRALRTVVGALGGAALTPADFPSILGYGATWRPRGPWRVGLEYGMDYPPADVQRATALLARGALVGAANIGTGTLDDRATSVTYADAGLTYSLTTAGVRDAATNIPEVNAVITRYGAGAVVA